MNLPNAITLSRLVVTAATFVCLELVEDGSRPDLTLVWWAFALFLVAACTDFLDGYFARKWNMVTAFGRVADPFAIVTVDPVAPPTSIDWPPVVAL